MRLGNQGVLETQEIRSRLLSSLSDKQREFVTYTGRYRAAICGRRAGKSDAAVSWLVEGGLDCANEVSPYVALSRSRAVEITARAFRRIERDTGLVIPERQELGQVYRVMPNGHRIWLVGCDDKAAIDKLRGDPYRRVVIDEADSMRPYLASLVDDVLGPTLMDLNGELAMIGTPGPIPAGLFYTATTGDGDRQWPTFRWTTFDNPFLPDPRGKVQEIIDNTGRTWDSPSIQREYFARWVRDDDSLCYPYDIEKNGILCAPIGDLVHVIGIDLGVTDPCAFVVGGYRRGLPDRFLLHAEKHSGMIPSRAAAKVCELLAIYPRARIIADAGGLGKAYVAEWASTYNINAEEAEKLGVAGQIGMVAGWLRTGECKVVIPECRPLIDEWAGLWWSADRKGHDVACEDHCSDAARYCLMGMTPVYVPQEEEPKYGSREALEAELRRDKERLMNRKSRRRA